MDEICLRKTQNEVDVDFKVPNIKHIKCNLDEWSKKDLLDLLIHMETEMTTLEFAFNILKSTVQKEKQYLKYGFFESLNNDNNFFEEELADSKKDNMKSEFKLLKNNLDEFSNSKSKYYEKMQSVMNQVSQQYQYSCDEFTDAKDIWTSFNQQLHQLQHQSKQDKDNLIKQLDQVVLEKGKVIKRMEKLEVQVVSATLHRDGAILLVNERTWLWSKISALNSLVTELEADLDVLKNRNLALDTQLLQFNSMKKSMTDDEKEKDKMSKEFEMRMKAKDDEIIRLGQEVNKLKLNQYCQTHLTTPSLFHNSSTLSTSSKSPQMTPTTLKGSTTNSSSSTPFKIPSTQPHNFFSFTSSDPQMTIKRALQPSPLNTSILNLPPLNTTQLNTTPLNKTPLNNLHAQHPPSHLIGHLDYSQDNPHSNNSSDIGLESPYLETVSTSASDSTNDITIDSTKAVSINQKGDEEETRFNIFGAEMADLQELISSVISKHPCEGPSGIPGESLVNRTPSNSSSLRSSPTLSASSSTSTIIENEDYDSEMQLDLAAIQLCIASCDSISLKQLLESHQQLNETYRLPNGTHPTHFCVECGANACLQLFLEHGYNTNALDADKMTALNLSASEGSITSLAQLLKYGASVHQANHIAMTPLHLAASNGHVDCCLLLLAAGAAVDAVNINNWTPLHTATFSNHHQCLHQMLFFSFNHPAKDQEYKKAIQLAINIRDKDGCTLVHLAIAKDTTECLKSLLTFSGGALMVDEKDRWGRTAHQIASPRCLSLLYNQDSNNEITCDVRVNLQLLSDQNNTTHNFNSTTTDRNDHHMTYSSNSSMNSDHPNNNNAIQSPYSSNQQQINSDSNFIMIGSVTVSKGTEWKQLEELLSSTFNKHIGLVSVGIRSNKISKHEQNMSTQSSLTESTPTPFTLGIGIKSIKYYTIGRYHWSPGTVTEKSPYEMLTTHDTTAFSIKLFDDNSVESLSYHILIPVFILQNYLRIIQQYKSVVFYGPKGTGKSYLCEKLATYIQMQDSSVGVKRKLSINNMNDTSSSQTLIDLLIQTECLIPSKQSLLSQNSCVLVLDGLTPLQLQVIFAQVASILDSRGPSHLINIQHGESTGTFYMHPNCYIICNMDTNRSIGLDLSIQQRFKWVHLRSDQEPCRYLLHRHLSRKLINQYAGVMPPLENSLFKAVEWLLMVWQRLNEGILKLGLVDVTFEPCIFLSCPILNNKARNVLRWLVSLWNQTVVPLVSQAVLRSSRSVLSSSRGDKQANEDKVVGAALNVLMQRAVVPDCPLSGAERDRYFTCFRGVHEADIKLKDDKHKMYQNSLQRNQPNTNEAFAGLEQSQRQGGHQNLKNEYSRSQVESTSLQPSSSFSSSSSSRTIVIKPSKQVNSHRKLHFSSDTSLPTSHQLLVTDPNKPPINKSTITLLNSQVKQPQNFPNNKQINKPHNNSAQFNQLLNNPNNSIQINQPHNYPNNSTQFNQTQNNPNNGTQINSLQNNKSTKTWLPNISIFSPKSNNIKKENGEMFVRSASDQVIIKQPSK